MVLTTVRDYDRKIEPVLRPRGARMGSEQVRTTDTQTNRGPYDSLWCCPWYPSNMLALNIQVSDMPSKERASRTVKPLTDCQIVCEVPDMCGGSFMKKPFSESMQLMNEMSKNNRAWYTRDVEVADLGFTFELSAEQRKEKKKGIRPPNRYEDQGIDLDEEAKYLGNQGGFRDYNSGNQGYNSGNTGRKYSKEGQYDRPINKKQGNWQNRHGYRNDSSGVYAPLGNRDRALEDATTPPPLVDTEAKSGAQEKTCDVEGDEEIITDDTMVQYVHIHEHDLAARQQLIDCFRSMWIVNRSEEFFNNGIVTKSGSFKNRPIMPDQSDGG
uniref:Integrase core domain containing protein n=1 Tax=Solanum tuberosum TaxID=4113 RepID=M1DSJ4_SOLTU